MVASGDAVNADPFSGIGSGTFTRATTRYIRTWDNTYVLCAAGELGFQGARRIGENDWSWKLADGTPLHPTRHVDGVRIFDVYKPWKASTAVAVGDRIIPTSNIGPAGGDGFYYEVTVGGTTGGAEPTWDTTIGNTTADNTVTWTNKGYYRIDGARIEPAVTNSLLHSRDFGNAAWTSTGTPVLTQNQIGIDGVANTAFTVTDDDGVSVEGKLQNITVPDDSNSHLASVYIKKDADNTTFPAVGFQLLGGTTIQQRSVHINTSTGATAAEMGAANGSHVVEEIPMPDGTWYRVTVKLTNNSTGNVTARTTLNPARATSFGGGNDGAAMRSATFDQAQLELNVGLRTRPADPVVTTTAAATKNVDDLRYDVGNSNAQQGMAVADYRAPDWLDNVTTTILGNVGGGAVNSVWMDTHSTGNCRIVDTAGNFSVTGPTNPKTVAAPTRGATRWQNGVEVQAALDNDQDGVLTGTPSANGSTMPTGGTIGIGRHTTNRQWRGSIKNVRLYNYDGGTAKIEALAAMETRS